MYLIIWISYHPASYVNTNSTQEDIDEHEVEESESLDKELLISEVHEWQCLWNIKSGDYKDINKKRRAWNVIYENLGKKDTGTGVL